MKPAVFCVGGKGSALFQDSVECMRPAQRWFSACRILANPRAGLGAALLEGKLYTVGGLSDTVVRTLFVGHCCHQEGDWLGSKTEVHAQLALGLLLCVREIQAPYYWQRGCKIMVHAHSWVP